MTYHFPSTSHGHTLIEKKSLFHAFAGAANSREQAMQVLAQQQTVYPDARHHCWAYLIGDPRQPITIACNDDGEPSGTAGKPMLNVLQHGDIGNVMVVISRYFGGVKLGAGGLVRAYSKATGLVLENLATTPYIPLIHISVTVAFKDEQFIRHCVTQHQGLVKECIYSSHSTMKIALPEAAKSTFIQQIQSSLIKETP
ncbi:MAG: YigZ family protein [Glaciecola sp.]|jgi:uncharacterized YigZ family protein|nr:YigZ family protein [Glaciecola sp.]MDG1469540.1 YigZ family protein [Glaciecola sp.]MDG1921720.1 YigZ family protein [Glaciecola sp.]